MVIRSKIRSLHDRRFRIYKFKGWTWIGGSAPLLPCFHDYGALIARILGSSTCTWIGFTHADEGCQPKFDRIPICREKIVNGSYAIIATLKHQHPKKGKKHAFRWLNWKILRNPNIHTESLVSHPKENIKKKISLFYSLQQWKMAFPNVFTV